MLPDTGEQPSSKEPAILVIDDDDSIEVQSPIIIEDDSCDQAQISSNEKEMDGFAVSQCNSSGGVGEQNLGENLCQSTSDPEANLEIEGGKLSADEEPVFVMEQPRKRKDKTKNVSVTPGKPIKPSTPVPPCMPAMPFPLDMSVLSGLPVLPISSVAFQQLPGGQGRQPSQ